MIVVAILAVMAAIAVPSLLPMVQRAERSGRAEQVMAFIHRAQMQALQDRRCTRVYIDTTQGPARLVAEVANVYDCDVVNAQTVANAPRIDGAAPSGTNHWLFLAELVIRTPALRVEWHEVPTDTAPHGADDGSHNEIRFRPSGRVFSADADLTDDDAVVRILHDLLPGGIYLLVEGHGPMCRLEVPPPGPANNHDCP